MYVLWINSIFDARYKPSQELCINIMNTLILLDVHGKNWLFIYTFNVVLNTNGLIMPIDFLEPLNVNNGIILLSMTSWW